MLLQYLGELTAKQKCSKHPKHSMTTNPPKHNVKKTTNDTDIGSMIEQM
jgi:hypothetical protein